MTADVKAHEDMKIKHSVSSHLPRPQPKYGGLFSLIKNTFHGGANFFGLNYMGRAVLHGV